MASLRSKKLPSQERNDNSRTSIGLAGISSQVIRKVTRKGFDFCLMVVGESGLGKSTLLNTLFMGSQGIPLGEKEAQTMAESRIEKTVHITTRTMDIAEKNVHVKLTLVDTPGFGDAVNNENCWAPVVEYVDNAFMTFLHGESRVDRAVIVDNRVHCCLYFIDPSAHGCGSDDGVCVYGCSLKPVDIKALSALQHKVNIVPIIAKADTLTKTELKNLKNRIREDLKDHEIQCFVPSLEEGEDEASYQEALELSTIMPFGVVGCNKIIEVGGRSLRGRVYPWGVVEIDNKEHCDFEKMRSMLIRTHTQEMKDVTTEILYESWRRDALAANPKLLSDLATRKMDDGHVKEQEKMLAESESDLLRRHEQMKRDIEEQQRALEETKKQIEAERRKMESMKAQRQ